MEKTNSLLNQQGEKKQQDDDDCDVIGKIVYTLRIQIKRNFNILFEKVKKLVLKG